MNNSNQNDASLNASGSIHPFSDSPYNKNEQNSPGEDSSLDAKIRSRLRHVYSKAESPENNQNNQLEGVTERSEKASQEFDVRQPEHPKRSSQLRKTVKDLESMESQVRRMKLDPTQSFGMSVKRPTGEQSGTYQVLSSPQRPDEQKEEKGLLCSACGTRTEQKRLSCPACGTYFNSAVQSTSFEKKRTKEILMTSSSSSLPVYKQDAETGWQILLLKRVYAKAIDLLLVGTVYGIIVLSYIHYQTRVVSEMPDYEPLFLDITYCVLPLIGIVILVAYNALFESSPLMATAGKFVAGLTVSKSDGKVLSHVEALGRSFITHLPLILLVASLWFTKLINPAISAMNNQSVITTSQVLGVAGVFCLLAYSISLAWMMNNAKNQTLGDILTGTVVETK